MKSQGENSIRLLNKPGLVNRSRLLDKLELLNSFRPADSIQKTSKSNQTTPN